MRLKHLLKAPKTCYNQPIGQNVQSVKFFYKQIARTQTSTNISTKCFFAEIISKFTEAYRSGHNGAVLKTVKVQAYGGSSPSASAIYSKSRTFCPTFTVYYINILFAINALFSSFMKYAFLSILNSEQM